jgi:hypothetical protein
MHRKAELDRTLATFLGMLEDFFGDRLVSVVLYGSVVFDDLAPGYGDLDFLAVVEGDLDEETQRRLVELRVPLRRGDCGILGKMIEGAFLPRRMLDPTVRGAAFWWGTTKDRPWETNGLGPLVLHVIRERGVVIRGEDVRGEIPAPTREEMVGEVRSACDSMRQHGRGRTLHSVDWLLSAARLLLWLREGRLSSKTEAAEWGQTNARGEWRVHLRRAKEVRLKAALADSPDVKRWLDALDGPIRRAAEELDAELRRL